MEICSNYFKPKHLFFSYRPISLLPKLAKHFEKLLLKRIHPIIHPIMFEKDIIPNTQFGFRPKHSTIHQICRLTDSLALGFETKQYCTDVFLDSEQAFLIVWYIGLSYEQLISNKYFRHLTFYYSNLT